LIVRFYCLFSALVVGFCWFSELAWVVADFCSSPQNQHSSRSHCVLTVSVERREKGDTTRTYALRRFSFFSSAFVFSFLFA
jgi:hypothetical protein